VVGCAAWLGADAGRPTVPGRRPFGGPNPPLVECAVAARRTLPRIPARGGRWPYRGRCPHDPSNTIRIVLACLAVLCAAGPVAAQRTTGAIIGTVQDAARSHSFVRLSLTCDDVVLTTGCPPHQPQHD
jgi:hypothetical protein